MDGSPAVEQPTWLGNVRALLGAEAATPEYDKVRLSVQLAPWNSNLRRRRRRRRRRHCSASAWPRLSPRTASLYAASTQPPTRPPPPPQVISGQSETTLPAANYGMSNTVDLDVEHQLPLAAQLAERGVQRGYMHKLGKNVTKWKRRFFVLQPTTMLYYYLSAGDSEPAGVVNMDLFTEVVAVEPAAPAPVADAKMNAGVVGGGGGGGEAEPDQYFASPASAPGTLLEGGDDEGDAKSTTTTDSAATTPNDDRSVGTTGADSTTPSTSASTTSPPTVLDLALRETQALARSTLRLRRPDTMEEIVLQVSERANPSPRGYTALHSTVFN